MPRSTRQHRTTGVTDVTDATAPALGGIPAKNTKEAPQEYKVLQPPISPRTACGPLTKACFAW